MSNKKEDSIRKIDLEKNFKNNFTKKIFTIFTMQVLNKNLIVFQKKISLKIILIGMMFWKNRIKKEIIETITY